MPSDPREMMPSSRFARGLARRIRRASAGKRATRSAILAKSSGYSPRHRFRAASEPGRVNSFIPVVIGGFQIDLTGQGYRSGSGFKRKRPNGEVRDLES